MSRPLLAALCLAMVLPGAALAQHEEQLAPLLAPYWARETVAVQPLAHPKARCFELTAHAGVIPNDPFVVYLPLGIRAGFHLSERWALEIGVSYNLQLDTDLLRYLEDNDAQLGVRARGRQQLRAAATMGWSPVYGKLALGSWILHMDLHLLAGGGIVRTGEAPEVDLGAATRPDFQLGLGMRFFLGGRWLLRLQYRQHLFLRPEDRRGGGGGVGFPSEIGLGVGILLGGRGR